MTEIQCCLDHQIVDLFHKIVVSSYSSSVQSFIKYQLTSVLLSQLRASGISSVPKKQGIVIENLANAAYFIPTRGVENSDPNYQWTLLESYKTHGATGIYIMTFFHLERGLPL